MEYTAEQLNQIDVHSLRNLAREIGVRAPSALNKKALINEIIAIKSGKKAPQAISKKGRPIKNHIKRKIFENLKTPAPAQTLKMKKREKKAFINSILKEIEKKLNEIL